MLMAPGEIHPVLGFIAILAIAVGGGASGALNMWYDADIDQMMGRTAKRPIPAGQCPPKRRWLSACSCRCFRSLCWA
jgi:protoheme IX farnesyltransferase